MRPRVLEVLRGKLGFLFIFGLIASGDAVAKEKQLPITPSFARPVTIDVYRGETVSIPLLAVAGQRETRFLLRSRPLEGVLGEITRDGLGGASVTYTHNGGSASGDGFDYAVQNPGGAVSGRARVDVRVLDRSARLAASGADFGRVPVGASATRWVSLSNVGGLPFAGRLELTTPFYSETRILKIPPGGTLALEVSFQPDSERLFETSASARGDGGCQIPLRGEGIRTFSTSVGRLDLTERADRAGAFEVISRESSDAKLVVEADPPLHVPATVSLAAGGQASVAVAIDAAFVSGGEGSVRLRDERGAVETVTVRFPPLPARLEVSPAAIDFAPGEVADGKVRLVNAGGTALPLTLVAPEWVEVTPDRFRLLPGQSVELSVRLLTVASGTREGRLLFSHGEQFVTIRAAAKVTASVPDPVSGATPAAATNSGIDLREAAALALRVGSIAQNGRNVRIEWRDPDPMNRSYRIERLRISSTVREAAAEALADPSTEHFDAQRLAESRLSGMRLAASGDDRVIREWVPLPGVEIHGADGSFVVNVNAPSNAPQLRLRIVPLRSDGSPSPYASELTIPLRMLPPSYWLLWAIGSASAALLVLLLIRFRRRFLDSEP